MEEWYQIDASQAIKKLESSREGLSSEQAAHKLWEFGSNEFKKKKEETILQVFARQFISPIIFLLLGAAAISFFLGGYSRISGHTSYPSHKCPCRDLP